MDCPAQIYAKETFILDNYTTVSLKCHGYIIIMKNNVPLSFEQVTLLFSLWKAVCVVLISNNNCTLQEHDMSLMHVQA